MMIKHFAFAAATAFTTVAIATTSTAQSPSTPLLAQASSPSQSGNTVVIQVNPDLNRAKNLARQAAERANGGLSQYRADAAMHGPAAATSHVDNGNGSWTFTFVGGTPGYTTPTIESVVTVFREGWRVVIDYNGPIRLEQQQ